ncbi:MAG: mechanosensitive ion channel [Flavobacteriales bacterium]|nr:mechanosensitive ion channel [Flavobacteriales bacterium]
MTIIEILEFHLFTIGDFTLTIHNLALVVFILLFTWGILGFINRLFQRHWKRDNWETGRSHSLFKIVQYFVWIIAIIACFNALGMGVTWFLAGSAALGLGLGFGLQTFFSDIISGIFLLVEGTIEVDDVIEVDSIVGNVKKISLRATTITTRDDIIIIVPNHKFFTDNVINWSHNEDQTRFSVTVGVAYGSDTTLVKKILLECIAEHPEVLPTPDPIVRFNDFGDSSLDFEVFFWSENIFRIERIQSDIRFLIDQKFRDNAVEIPFPQRDLHIRSGLK